MAVQRNLSREDIVIVGMACRFSEVPDLAAFWKMILLKRAAFSEVSFSGRQMPEGDCRKTLFGPALPTYAAQLGDLFSCNPEDQCLPRKINAGENQDLFFVVQLASDALRDSGEAAVNSLPTDRVSLHLGYAPPFNTASVNWLQHTFFLDLALGLIRKFFPGATEEQLSEIRCRLAASIPAATPYAFLSAMGSVTASWIASLLGLAGPAFVLDEGAVSGIQALQGARDDLLAKRSDIALAGAVQPPLNPAFMQGVSGAYRFSRYQKVCPFSRDADGTLPGEGGVFFVLKRLKDALRHGDRIYAILRGTGITAASPDRQASTPEQLTRALGRAFRTADVPPDSIRMIEAHGSGIPHFDQTELRAFQEFYSAPCPGRPLIGIGSVKGNIGHTLRASGAAGVAKAALAIYHRLLPPQVPVNKPYPQLSAPHAPIYLLTEARPWLCGNPKQPRRACVSSIDFTGTCGAVVLEEYPEDSE